VPAVNAASLLVKGEDDIKIAFEELSKIESASSGESFFTAAARIKIQKNAS
jgi:hypothetical protein